MSTKFGNVTTGNCRDWIANGAVPEADTEISGIGAILAFLLSAYITFAIVLIAYFLGSIDGSLLRPVDLYVHKLPSQRRTSPSWHKALQQCVLLLSDQQIVTGIAICTAGFIGLRGHISVYHFQIVIMLAWMSSSVHLSALTMLAEYFRKRPAVLGWRIGGMLILFVLLLAVLVPTSSNLWGILWTSEDEHFQKTSWAIPAKCFYFHTWGEGVNPDAPLAYLILILSYIWKVGALFKGPRNTFHSRIRGPYEYILERVLHAEALKGTKGRKNSRLSWTYHATMVVYIMLLAFFEFSASFAASLWLSYVGLVYGTIQIVIPRQQNSWWLNNKENEWTFGQITVLILLIQPIGAILENFKGRKHNGRPDCDPISGEEDAYELNPVATTAMLPKPTTDASALTFSETFARLEVLKPSERSLELADHQVPFYSSVLFATLIGWIQVGIVVISSVVFWFDSQSIGLDTSHNYFFVLIGVGAFVGITVLWTVASIPFSRVFR